MSEARPLDQGGPPRRPVRNPNPGADWPILAWLADLRGRLVRVLLAGILGTGVAWGFREEIFQLLLRPATRALGEAGALQAIAPTEIFFTYLKASLLTGFVVTIPVFFWELWQFIRTATGLGRSWTTAAFAFASTALFAGGVLFGHTLVFPLVFDFFASFSSEFVEAAWTMREVFTLSIRLILAFGIGFELPLLTFFLAATGIVSPQRLLKFTPYGVLLAFVLAAVLTPPDVVSQLMLAAPLSVLYLIGVGAGMLVAKRH
jgi:sec-independent protein translocase protein TatC